MRCSMIPLWIALCTACTGGPAVSTEPSAVTSSAAPADEPALADEIWDAGGPPGDTGGPPDSMPAPGDAAGGDAAAPGCYCPSKNTDPVYECRGTYKSCPFGVKQEDCKLREHPIWCNQDACGTEQVMADTGCEWKQVLHEVYGCFSTGSAVYCCGEFMVEPAVQVRNDRCPDTPVNTCNEAACQVRVGDGEWFDNACTTTPP